MSDTPEVLVPEGEGGTLPVTSNPKDFDVPCVITAGGMQIPKLGFGTYELEGQSAYDMTLAALNDGIVHIDTAQMYGNEDRVGAAIATSSVTRSEIFLTTKIDNHQHEPAALTASIHASLRKLQTDYVDLLLIHWPVEWDAIGATLATLTHVQGAGLARHIGVSNFTQEQLEIATRHAPLEVLQVECHPYFQQPELRAWCADNGWAFTAYSPLGQGKAIGDAVLDDIGSTHGVSGTAVALAWMMTLPQVNVIPRTSSVEHLHANNQARSIELTDAEKDRIAGLADGKRLIDPDFGPWNITA